jgi:hypothetical protein
MERGSLCRGCQHQRIRCWMGPRFKLLCGYSRGAVLQIKVVQLGECGPVDEKIEPNIKSLLDQYGLLFQGPKGL